MNAYDELSSKDCRSNPYDYLPFEERRTIARWRAVTTAIAASAVLGIFGVIALVDAGNDDAHVAAAGAAPAASVPASPGNAAVAASRDGARRTLFEGVVAKRHAASVAALGS
jgi:hypothetical protein